MADLDASLLLLRLDALLAAASPYVYALVRAVAGLALVPHGLRAYCGLFRNTGSQVATFAQMAVVLEKSGFPPGRFWAVVVALLEFVGGPMLALGLFTRLVALPIFVFLVLAAYVHGRDDGYFWNTQGLEYPAVWAALVLVFVVEGGGAFSLDHLLFGAGP